MCRGPADAVGACGSACKFGLALGEVKCWLYTIRADPSENWYIKIGFVPIR